DGGVPPRDEVDDVDGAREVQARAASLERDEKEAALARLEARDERGALGGGGGSVEIEVLEAPRVEGLADDGEVARELAEDEDAVAAGQHVLEQLEEGGELRRRGALVVQHEARVAGQEA